jgi:hypothetical protein
MVLCASSASILVPAERGAPHLARSTPADRPVFAPALTTSHPLTVKSRSHGAGRSRASERHLGLSRQMISSIGSDMIR